MPEPIIVRDFPQYAKRLLDIEERLVDLKVVIQEAVYDVSFKGSYSLKAVAPALFGKDGGYDHLEIQDGIETMIAFEHLIDADFSLEKKESLKKSMLAYCKQDTLVMVKLVACLKKKAFQ
jgi:hypothetical protein